MGSTSDSGAAARRPGVMGNALAMGGGVSFLFLCMILPLVGPSGVATAHAEKNALAFGGVLAAATVLSALALGVKLRERRSAGGRFPWYSGGMVVFAALTWLAFLAGLLGL